jgi:hypothetical protein
MKWNGKGVLKIGKKLIKTGERLPDSVEVKNLSRKAQAGIIDDSGKPFLKSSKKEKKKEKKKEA